MRAKRKREWRPRLQAAAFAKAGSRLEANGLDGILSASPGLDPPAARTRLRAESTLSFVFPHVTSPCEPRLSCVPCAGTEK